MGDAPAVGQLAPPTLAADAASQDAARAAAQRFATDFATPNGNRDDWLARICGDVSDQLAEQYRLTDIRNVTQADVTSVDGPVRQEPAPSPSTWTTATAPESKCGSRRAPKAGRSSMCCH